MNIFEAITGIIGEAAYVGKDSKNQQQGFKYRGIDAVMNTFNPLLAKYKVFVAPEVLSTQREERQTTRGGNLIYSLLTIKFRFYAEDGTHIEVVTVGEGMDSGDKSCNKAMSVAFKYALFQVFCIPTEEMVDPDAESFEPSRPVDALDAIVDKTSNAGILCCEECGEELKPYKRKDGTVCTAKELADGSQQMFGHIYCKKCAVKHK